MKAVQRFVSEESTHKGVLAFVVNVFGTTLPIWIGTIFILFFAQNPEWERLYQGGELFLYAASFGTGVFSYFIISRNYENNIQLLALLAASLLVFVSAIIYSFMFVISPDNGIIDINANKPVLMISSWVIIAFSLFLYLPLCIRQQRDIIPPDNVKIQEENISDLCDKLEVEV